MKNSWIRLGCFLTGYNYKIVMNSSEISAMKVKQNLSALMIVCILWSFIGFSFTQRYLKAELLGSIFGAILSCVIIIQIERQIILSVYHNKYLYFMRLIIALMMAVIGSVIIDQVIFKQDVEKRKISSLDKEVNQVFPIKSEELRLQTKYIDSTLSAKEASRDKLADDLSRNPTIKIYNNQSSATPVLSTTTDSANNVSSKTVLIKSKSTSSTSIPNPKMGMLEALDKQISDIRIQKMRKDNDLLTLRSSIEKDIKEKVGFLDELKIMVELISESIVARAVWGIWFLILLGLELFILASKMGEQPNVYDETLIHQEKVQKRKLELLAKPE
ncbi:DUF4407 domain-containing protein [Pedobacter psychroterrae]|uniref:DUF4407 domain-containing protein n=1 Tax=Pedobacter psychroterrae TaxID=2530453 RepID=A0A4R0NKD6_9SPHI|nr:DUF4407 domain-containing protein [Pedobacter psychroterrae]TCC99952.1 DUF4407 domain-containing protein [Pedobacter psychroterrae]